MKLRTDLIAPPSRVLLSQALETIPDCLTALPLLRLHSALYRRSHAISLTERSSPFGVTRQCMSTLYLISCKSHTLRVITADFAPTG